jgi:predicted transcriptional regulator
MSTSKETAENQPPVAKRPVSIWMESELLARLDALAQKRRYSRSSLVCLLVERELGDPEEESQAIQVA